MNLESPKINVKKTQKELFEFLMNTRNFEQLLPDSLEEFKANDDSFKFALKGMPAIRLAFTEKIEYDIIKLKATSDSFPVFLICKINSVDEKKASVQLFFEGKINPMMAMMIKKPLQNLLDTLSEKIGVL
jgi:carbon monoxide dehydrogenase subunit G